MKQKNLSVKKVEPNWLRVVSFKTELLSEYLIHRGYREDLPRLLPEISSFNNRMIIDNDIYVDLNEVNKIQDVLSEDIVTYAKNIYSTIRKQSEKLIDTADIISRKNTEGLNSQEIIDDLNLFFNEYKAVLGLIGIPTIIDITLESLLKDKLKKTGARNIDEAFSQLATSREVIATNQERVDLIDIAIKQKTDEGASTLIAEHAKKYGWIQSTLFLGDAYTAGDIRDELSKIKNPEQEKEKILNNRKSHLSKAQNIIDGIISENDKAIAFLLQDAVYYRTARLEWLNQACFLIRPLLSDIAKRLNIKFDDLIYLLPDEINNYLTDTKQIKIDIIRDRQKGYAFVSDGKREYVLLTGKDLEKLSEGFSVQTKDNVIKGVVASRGRAVGCAVVLKDRSELNKVTDGDIIITPLTTPDFVIAMKKASAIVTDLGGLTSHAAIVSRELNIPCIVGTKIATKVLKDGDEVEVDADNGIVRIIKKAE